MVNTLLKITFVAGLKCKSALFRHEIAYVLGQIQSDASVTQLSNNLMDAKENPMVRHECAEALGSIATDKAVTVLQDYLKDSERVVRESCIVALDMSEYENSSQFQYADTLQKVADKKTADVIGWQLCTSSYAIKSDLYLWVCDCDDVLSVLFQF